MIYLESIPQPSSLLARLDKLFRQAPQTDAHIARLRQQEDRLLQDMLDTNGGIALALGKLRLLARRLEAAETISRDTGYPDEQADYQLLRSALADLVSALR